MVFKKINIFYNKKRDKKMKLVEQLIKIAASIYPNKTMQKIINALQQFNTISIDYRKLNGQFESYVIVPVQIKNKNKKLVLYAEDIDQQNKTKSFIIKNILKIRNYNRDNKTKHPIKIQKN